MPADLHPVPTPRSRAVLYLRQSTYREDSISLELQETAGREYCARLGYDVVRVEADEGISGRRWSNRPAVQRVMQMIDARQADVIVVWKWSRLSRNRLDWAVAIDEVEQHGGRVESATEPVDTSTSTGRLARGMLAEFAAFESERIGDTWRETHRRRLASGLPHTNTPRFGYQLGDDGIFHPDPDTGPVLRRMYLDYVAGAGLREIAKDLNRRGITSVRGNPWTEVTVSSCLSSGFGAGLLNTKNAHIPGAHEPVITKDQWEAFLSTKRRRHTRGERPRESRYLLRGLVICTECGHRMYGKRVRGRYSYYECRWSADGFHPANSISQLRLDDMVHRWTETWQQRLTAAIQGVPSPAPIMDAPSVENRLSRLTTQLDRLTMGWTKGLVPDDAYQTAVGEITAERERLQQERDEVGRRRAAREAQRATVATVVGEWGRYTAPQLNRILATVIDEIRVRPGAYPLEPVEQRAEITPVSFL
jgi:DNA invertase Pin-like site-specific DNA recombinase